MLVEQLQGFKKAAFFMTKTTRKNRDFAIRGMALLVLLSFTVTSVAMPSPARAQAAELAVSPVIPVADFRIPDELGTVSARYEAPGPGSSGKAPILTNATTTRRTVVLIQDAHAVDDAQENIRKIIGHLQSRGQADVLFVEGAQGSLDPELLRSFPDKKIRNQVMAAYLAKAELSGAESAAILNPEDGKFEGLEDWALYSENYLAFQRAQKEKDTLLAALAKFRADLDAAGSRQIPEDLAEFLSQWADFRAERISLLDLVVTIQGYPAAAKIKADFPEVAKLIETFGYERSGRQESLEPLVKTIAAEFKQKYGRTMDVRAQSSFFIMYQKFLTGQASAAEMLGYLVDFGKARGQRLKMTPELKRLLGHAQTLAEIRGSRLFDELNRFLPRVARSLARTSADLRTADHYAKLFILEDLASLELTHQTLSEYQKDPESYLGLVNDPDLRSRFTPAIEFYQTALRRDRVFYEKVRAVKNARSIVIIAGGFHTNGLERILKENGESYVVVTPKIASLAGAGNYFTVMAGDLSYKDYLKTTYYDALMRHAVRSLTATLKEPEFRQTIKRWRDNLIRALAAKGRIDDLGRYTRYLDDLNLVYAERFAKNLTPRTKEDILDFIRKEFVKFRAEAFDSLQRRFEGQLSKFTADIQNLTGRNQLTEASVEAVLRESGLTGRSMLGAPSAMAPENPVLGDPGIAGPEGSTIPWRNEAGAADGRDLSRLAGMGGFYIDGISSAGNVLDAANALKAAANSDRSFHEKTTAPSEVLVTLIPNGMKLIIAPRHVIDPRNVPGEPGKKHYMSHEEFSEAAGFEEQPAETVRMLLFFDHWTGNFSEMLLVPGVGQRREDVLPLFSFLRNALIKTGNPAEAVDGSLMMDPFGDGEITLGDFIGRQELRSPFPRIIQKILMAGTVAGLLAIPAITAAAAPAISPERVKKARAVFKTGKGQVEARAGVKPAARRSETRSLASILASVLPEETVALTVWDYDTGAGDFIRAIYEWLRDQGYKNEIDVFGTERDETVVKPAFRDRIIRYSAEDPVGLPGRRPGSVRVIFANNLVARESGDLEAGPLAREAMKYLDPESGVLLVTIEASDAAAGRDEKVLYDLEKAGFKVLMQDVPADYPDYETVFKHSKLIVAIPPRAETRAEDKDRAAFREVGGDREWKSSVGSSAIRIRPQNGVVIETPSNKNKYRFLLKDDRGLRIGVQRFELTPSGELIEGSIHWRELGPVYIGHFYGRLGDRNSFGVGDGFLLAPVHCQIDFGKDDKGFYLTISDLSYEFTSIEGQTTGLTVKWTPQPGSDSVEELRVESTSADGDSDDGGSDDDDSGWLVDETPGTQDAYRGEDDLRDFLPDAETMPGTDKYVSIDVPAFYVRDGQLLVNESYHHPGVASRVLEKIAKDTNTVIRAEPQYAGLLARPGHEWMIGDEFVSDCFLHLVHLLHGELSPSDAVPLREFIRIYLEAMANYAAFLDAEGDPARKYVERISLENSLSRYLYFARLKMFREHPAWKLPVLYDAAVNPPVIAYRPGMNPLKCDPEVMTVLGIYKDKGAATGRKATGRRVVIDGKSTFLEPEKIVLVQWKGRTFLLYSSRTHKVGVDARVWRHSETLVMGWMLKHMNDPAYPQNVDDLPPQLGVRLDTVIDEHADDVRGKDEFLAAANKLDVLAFPYWNDLEKIFLGEADQVPNSPQLGRARKYLASAAQPDNGQPVGDPWLGGDNKTKFQIKFYSRVLFGNMLEVTLKANGVTVFRDVFAPAHYKGPIILGRSVTNPYGILDSLAKVSGFADETRRPELLKHLSDILAAARISREHIRITWSGSRWQFENISRYDKKLTFARAETRGVYGQPLDEYIRTAPSADYSETVLSDPSEVVRLANEARDDIIKIGYSEPADPIAASFFANYLDPKRAAVFQGRDVTLTVFRMMPGTGLGRILERQLAFSEQGLYPFVVENAKGELVGHGYLTVFNYQPDQMRFRFSIHGSAGIPGPKEFAGRGYGTAVIALLGLIADRNTFLGRQMNSLGYLSAPEDFSRHGNLESMRDFLVRRGFTDETEEPLDPRLIFRIRPDQPPWFRSESRTIAQQIISSGSDAGSGILRERAEQRMSEIKGTMDVRFRELEAELAKYETAGALKSYIQSDPFREFMEQKFGEFPGIGILISDIIAYASGIEAVAPYHVDAGIIRVVPVEIAKLIKTLSLIGHESSLTVGLRAPAKGFDSEFMKMFLEVLAQRGVVNEVAVSGQLNGYQKQLTALKIATRSVRRLGDPFIPRNSQNAVPMIMNTDDRSVVDLLNEIFSPVMSDAEEVADPYVREFTNVLKIVAAIHIADLSKRIKDPGMLKAELLKRLNIAERTELQNLIRMDASGRGFTVSSAVVRIFLRMRAEESIAQAA